MPASDAAPAPLLFDALIAEIAEVLAQHRLLSARQAEGIFHIRAEASSGGTS
jgi:hypothetical protein